MISFRLDMPVIATAGCAVPDYPRCRITPVARWIGSCSSLDAAATLSGFLLRKLEPRIDDGIWIERQRLDPLFHKPFGKIRVIRRALAADADVLAFLSGRLVGHRQAFLDGGIAFVEQVSNDAAIAIEAQRQLAEGLRAEGEAVEHVADFLGADAAEA